MCSILVLYIFFPGVFLLSNYRFGASRLSLTSSINRAVHTKRGYRILIFLTIVNAVIVLILALLRNLPDVGFAIVVYLTHLLLPITTVLMVIRWYSTKRLYQRNIQCWYWWCG